jgi:hypothetical protein
MEHRRTLYPSHCGGLLDHAGVARHLGSRRLGVGASRDAAAGRLSGAAQPRLARLALRAPILGGDDFLSDVPAGHHRRARGGDLRHRSLHCRHTRLADDARKALRRRRRRQFHCAGRGRGHGGLRARRNAARRSPRSRHDIHHGGGHGGRQTFPRPAFSPGFVHVGPAQRIDCGAVRPAHERIGPRRPGAHAVWTHHLWGRPAPVHSGGPPAAAHRHRTDRLLGGAARAAVGLAGVQGDAESAGYFLDGSG